MLHVGIDAGHLPLLSQMLADEMVRYLTGLRESGDLEERSGGY